MKRLLICLGILFIFCGSVFAQSDSGMMGKGKEEMKHPAMEMGEGQQPMMMCPKMQQMKGKGMMGGGHQMPMMQQMMGHGMMVHDMMQMMIDIMNMQEKIINGVKPSDKKHMLDTIKDMKARVQDKMSMNNCMMGGMMGGMMSGKMEHKMHAPSKESEGEETEETEEHNH